jgi:hypothetical protein
MSLSIGFFLRRSGDLNKLHINGAVFAIKNVCKDQSRINGNPVTAKLQTLGIKSLKCSPTNTDLKS